MISIASDHGGYRLKEHIKAYLTAKGINVLDCGCDSQESCDYPIFAKAAAVAVADGRCEKGIVICTTGIGVSITANKVKGIRCALCSDPLCAEMTAATMMPICWPWGPASSVPIWPSASWMCSWTPRSRAGRHARRVRSGHGC